MNSKRIFSLTVLVAALGYFVDIYDLLLFNIVRVDSLKDLGLSPAQVKSEGEFIISIQMIGLLVGGILWGVLGDKRGRLSVLFGSIILYSVANIVNGFVVTVNQYALVRFIAGVGLAGELGAGITLVSELVGKEKRGISTSLVSGIGILGAVVAYFISKNFDWRICYFIGGGLGICLLLLRISVFESNMFEDLKASGVSRGNFFMLFNNGKRLKKYLLMILIGLPTWYTIGILVAFSNNFAHEMGFTEEILPKKSTMYAYVAAAISGMAIGLLSNWWKSRKKALYLFFVIEFIGIVLYFQQARFEGNYMYLICGVLGLATGYWSIFVTMSAELFGTNLRATATTTIPNMVRGALPLMLLLFNGLQSFTHDYLRAGWITGMIILSLAVIATWLTEETFGRDLNFVEE
ncbi:MAG: hypothetical protein RLY16_2694 [Bacteroidota bacterium]|jgi:MFS family permease